LWGIVFVVTPVEISGQSMEKTLYDGEKVLVWRLNYEPTLYDIVVIDANEHYSFTSDTEFVIKRIMANSGDRVSLNLNGIYFINGRAVRQNISIDDFKMMLTDKCTNTTYYEFDEEAKMYYGIVPEGYCIVLGDNRINSMDSKSVGLVHKEDILGKSIFRIYPFSKMGFPN
jgi:signal peptidase I